MSKAPTREQVSLEFKALVSSSKAVDERTFTGFASVFGNMDDGGDCVVPGAFRKTINDGMRRVKHLWSHNPYEPPVAVIKELREASRDELPDEILDLYPKASGGLLVTREYLNTPRGNEILEGVSKGAITEMSFGFDVLKWEMEEVRDGSGAGMMIRNLKELRLWDTSDVTWGMNPATVAAKHGIPPYIADLAALSRAWVEDPDALKAGRVLSASNLERLKNAIDTLNAVLLAAEPPDTDESEDDESAVKALTEYRRRQLEIAEHQLKLYQYEVNS